MAGRRLQPEGLRLTIVVNTEPNDIGIYEEGLHTSTTQSPFDKVMADLDVTSDQAKRNDSSKAQKILANDAVVGYLYEPPKIGVGTPRSKACGRTPRSRRTTSPR